MTDSRISAIAIEVVTQPNADSRISAVDVEVVTQSPAGSRVSAIDVEVAAQTDAPGRLTRQVTSVLRQGSSGAALTRQVSSVLRQGGAPTSALTRQVVSLLRKINQEILPPSTAVTIDIGRPTISDAPIIQPTSTATPVDIGSPSLANFTADTQNRTMNPREDPEEPPHECNNTYVVPVQQGSVSQLTVAVSPGGKALFGWVDYTADEFRCAVRDDPLDIFTDDVVEPGDVRTVFAPPTDHDIFVASMFVQGGDLFVIISYWLTGPYPHPPGPRPHAYVKCYIADDPENPVVWTERGTLQDILGAPVGGLSPDGSIVASVDCQIGGIPTVLSTGRWVLPFQAWVAWVSTSLITAIGLWFSDDRGVTWTLAYSFRHPPLQSASAGPMSTSIARNPVDGQLYFGTFVGPLSQTRTYYSGNDGSSWSAGVEDGGTKDFYVDDGVSMYATYGGRDIYRVDDPFEVDTWELLCLAVDSSGVPQRDGWYSIPLFLDGEFWDFAFTAGDRIGYGFRPPVGRGTALPGPNGQRVHVVVTQKAGI